MDDPDNVIDFEFEAVRQKCLSFVDENLLEHHDAFDVATALVSAARILLTSRTPTDTDELMDFLTWQRDYAVHLHEEAITILNEPEA